MKRCDSIWLETIVNTFDLTTKCVLDGEKDTHQVEMEIWKTIR